MTFLSSNNNLLASTKQLTIILIITASVFAVFIIAAIIKMYKLKAENKKLLESNPFDSELDASYKDFREGHLYENQ